MFVAAGMPEGVCSVGMPWFSNADKRQHNNKKKKEQADQDRKYDSLRIYLGNTSDEWERQRTIIREIAFADAPIVIMDYDM